MRKTRDGKWVNDGRTERECATDAKFDVIYLYIVVGFVGLKGGKGRLLHSDL